MGYPTPIEWTDATWNPIGGCSIKSPGCINCYAQALAGTRLSKHPLYAGTTDVAANGRPVFNGRLTSAPEDAQVWTWPLRWRGAPAPLLGPGQPSTIFVGDMSDLFHERRERPAIDKIFGLMVACPKHIFQVLTKRPDVMCDYSTTANREEIAWHANQLLKADHFGVPCRWPRPNVWLGCSVERQQEADARREPMRKLAAMGFTTFVSYEPALGPVDWTGWEFVAQIISGGESGKDDPRPSHPDWHRAARDFAQKHGIAYFFKQWGEWAPAGSESGAPTCPGLTLIVMPWGSTMTWHGFHNARAGGELGEGYGRACRMIRAGKKAAGRLLDGREWNELPRAGVRPSGSDTMGATAEVS
jgi:protein gp37